MPRKGREQRLLVIVPGIAVVRAELISGILLGNRAGPIHALSHSYVSGFIQAQQIIYAHSVEMMPPFFLVASMLAVPAWPRIACSHWETT